VRNTHRSLDSITDDMAEIRQHTKKAVQLIEDSAEELETLYRDSDHAHWLHLKARAQELITQIRLTENKRLKPLQAEYSKAWNDKWRR